MIASILDILLSMICIHDWKLLKPVTEYYDISGYHVVVWECKCKKCNKIKNVKFY